MVLIAKERIGLLMVQADRAALAGRMEMADRYVDMARRIGMRYNVRLPSAFRRRICRGCHRYLHPGVTSRTRFKRGRLVTTCLRCGHISRIPLTRRGLPNDTPPSVEEEEPASEGGG